MPPACSASASTCGATLFKDRRVREAFVQLFDFEWINKNLFYGCYTRINSYFFGNSELASTGLPSPEELEDPRAAARQGPRRGLHPGVQAAGDRRLRQQPRQAARRALALLKEAGWEIKDGKMTSTATGKKLAFEMLLNEPRLRAHRPALQAGPGAARHRGDACAPSTRRSTSAARTISTST